MIFGAPVGPWNTDGENVPLADPFVLTVGVDGVVVVGVIAGASASFTFAYNIALSAIKKKRRMVSPIKRSFMGKVYNIDCFKYRFFCL
jgi:hypothetical protein